MVKTPATNPLPEAKPEGSLAERTADAIMQLNMETEGDYTRSELIALLEAAFLESSADAALSNCSPLLLTGIEPRFTGYVGDQSYIVRGSLPPVGTIYTVDNTRYYIRSHKEG